MGIEANPAGVGAFQVGRTAWPGVSLTLERFIERASEIGVTPENLVRRAADLFLAFACAEGDARALHAFEQEILSQLDGFVSRFALAPYALDEVRQRIRVKLLVGRSPGVGRYRGLGPLAAWVRVTAVRVAIDVAGAATSNRLADVDILDLGISLDDSPELATARNLYRERLRGALEETLRALAPRDRTLLRLYVVDGLNLDAMGAFYKVHRATVARWFVAIRARVFQSVRERLGLRGAPSHSEMWSLIALLQDDIQLSARRVLASGAAGAAPGADGGQRSSTSASVATKNTTET